MSEKEMKYIRTKDGIYDSQKTTVQGMVVINRYGYPENAIKKADTIPELCDATFYVRENQKPEVYLDTEIIKYRKPYKLFDEQVYLAIFTNKGLIYVAKIRDILPNGEIDWELL